MTGAGRLGDERVLENGDPFVEIGGNERYVAMCRKHFREAMG